MSMLMPATAWISQRQGNLLSEPRKSKAALTHLYLPDVCCISCIQLISVKLRTQHRCDSHKLAGWGARTMLCALELMYLRLSRRLRRFYLACVVD